MNQSLRAGAWMVAMLVTLAQACVVETVSGLSTGVVVTGPPPDPMQETRPAAAPPRAVWVAGYWHWTGMQYAWIPGHWEDAPAGTRWRAPRYLLRDGVYYYEPGGWLAAPR